MDSKEFSKKAMITEYVPTRLPVSRASLKAALTMAIACSDVMDQLKKTIIYGKAINLDEVALNVDTMSRAGDYLKDSLSLEASVGCTNDQVNIRLLHAAIGIFTESGELLEALLKSVNRTEDGAQIDKFNFAEELGDVYWYMAIAHDELGISEERVRQTVIAKLAARYPEKFTAEAALNRDLVAERKVLEAGLA